MTKSHQNELQLAFLELLIESLFTAGGFDTLTNVQTKDSKLKYPNNHKKYIQVAQHQCVIFTETVKLCKNQMGHYS